MKKWQLIAAVVLTILMPVSALTYRSVQKKKAWAQSIALLNSNKPEQRMLGMANIMVFPDSKTIPVYGSLLQDRSKSVRSHAAIQMVKLLQLSLPVPANKLAGYKEKQQKEYKEHWDAITRSMQSSGVQASNSFQQQVLDDYLEALAAWWETEGRTQYGSSR